MHTLHNAPTMMKGLPVSTPIYIKIQQKHKYKCKRLTQNYKINYLFLKTRTNLSKLFLARGPGIVLCIGKGIGCQSDLGDPPSEKIINLENKFDFWVWRCPETKNWRREYQKIRHWCAKQWVSVAFRACLLQQYRHILCGPRLIKCPRLVRQIHAAQSTGQPPSLTNMIFWAIESWTRDRQTNLF